MTTVVEDGWGEPWRDGTVPYTHDPMCRSWDYTRPVARIEGTHNAILMWEFDNAPEEYRDLSIIDKIDEGVAIVRVKGRHVRACQDCVEVYGLGVVRWERNR